MVSFGVEESVVGMGVHGCGGLQQRGAGKGFGGGYMDMQALSQHKGFAFIFLHIVSISQPHVFPITQSYIASHSPIRTSVQMHAK